ncbi:MAG: glycoside hydrolase family 43 protein [Oscillospiraceae bacterium]|nr:glycoside hydrolase family 43 protein [Oscillospiraceae bacterium]
MEAYFNGLTLTEPLKKVGKNNPLFTQRLGADPWVLSWGGRVWVYMTGDIAEYNADGGVLDNSYAKIQTINLISSGDMLNWTDHGAIPVAGGGNKTGAAKWAYNSWAPAVACRKIDGKDMFFLYFADSARGIGVLTADHPAGAFTDPLGHALINHSTPNCSDIKWLFDPAVLADGDEAYIYFGGGVPEGKAANPGTARVAKLNPDMTSLACDPIVIDAPYLYEDSGINKIGDVYYYSYCTNFDVDDYGREAFGIDNGEIAYMTSNDPMGLFEYKGSICKNPAHFFGTGGNNHHCIFEHNGRYYMAYHAFLLQDRMGLKGGYRASHIDELTVDADGSIQPVKYTEDGVNSIGNLNPFTPVKAAAIGTMAGITTKKRGGDVVVCGISSGDWLMVYRADFKAVNAKRFTACVKPPESGLAVIQVRADDEVVGYLNIPSAPDSFTELSTELEKPLNGVRDLTFVFYAEGNPPQSGLEFNWWKIE